MTKLSREIVELTDEQIEAAFNDTLTVDDLSFVDTTIDEFLAARANWAAAGEIVKQTATFLQIDGVQPVKGQRRRLLTIVDFGSCRAVDGADR